VKQETKVGSSFMVGFVARFSGKRLVVLP